MPRIGAWAVLAALLFAGLVAVVLRLAWVSDDAYITLRTVENWLAGDGLRWNVAERVQTYTHPAWMLCLAGARAATGEAYFGTLGLGVALTALAALAWMRETRAAAGAAAVAGLLVGSRAFTEFATSGLESPLVYLAVALLGATRACPVADGARLGRTALLTGLLVLTRLDLALLAAPVLLADLHGVPRRRALTRLFLGFLPLAAWLAFALLYYGTVLPVTAHAKALAGIPAGDLVRQGLHYCARLLCTDPLTAGVLVAGIGLGLARPELGGRGLAFGALLYCVYVIKVGGDFMAGRFFTPPFASAVTVLAPLLGRIRPATCAWTLAATVLLALAPGVPAWCRSPADETPPEDVTHGIVDERRFYFGELGLFSPRRAPPRFGAQSERLVERGRTAPLVTLGGAVGRAGFEAGPLVHVVDPFLCDPLLMRLPALARQPWSPERPDGWRIGHFRRALPTGYLLAVMRGADALHHPGLADYYRALARVLRAPLLSGERLRALGALWSGSLGGGLSAYLREEHEHPPCVPVEAAELAVPIERGAYWDDPRARLVERGGLEVRWPTAREAARLRLFVTGEARYRLRFALGDEVLGETFLAEVSPARVLLQPAQVDVPTSTAFDRLRIDVPNAPWDALSAVAGIACEGRE
jgi:arabinofuranosyltransferase